MDTPHIPLYVTRKDMDEAISLGARQILGDLRLYIPERPLDVAEQRAFARWQGHAARYAWCMELVRDVLGTLDGGVDPLHTMAALLDEDGYKDRVYLWATPSDSARLAAIKGVRWDRAARRYFVGRGVDMNVVYPWLTPEAQSVWEAQEAARSTLDWLVRDRARKEVLAASDGVTDGDGPSVGPLQRSHRQDGAR